MNTLKKERGTLDVIWDVGCRQVYAQFVSYCKLVVKGSYKSTLAQNGIYHWISFNSHPKHAHDLPSQTTPAETNAQPRGGFLLP